MTVFPRSRHWRMNLRDGARGHHVESHRGFVENHYLRIVHERARDGHFLLHAGGELFAATVAKAIHVEGFEERVHGFSQRDAVHAVKTAEIFNQLSAR